MSQTRLGLVGFRVCPYRHKKKAHMTSSHMSLTLSLPLNSISLLRSLDCFGHNSLERLGMIHCQVGEDFAVNPNVLLVD